MLNLSHDVSNASGDKTHLGIMLFVSRCLPVIARRWNAASSYWCPRHTSRAPADSHDIVITRAVCVPTPHCPCWCWCCKLSSGTSTDEIHTWACVVCCRGVRYSVRLSVCLSVCHKWVLRCMSKLPNVRSLKERCIVAHLRNLGFRAKDLDEIQTRLLQTGTPNAGGV